MVSAHNLTKVFKDKKRGKFKAIDGLNFTCEPGKIFGLLGINGAGKTTTLRIISTTMRPSDGYVTVDGFDVRKDAQKVREKAKARSMTVSGYLSEVIKKEVGEGWPAGYFERVCGRWEGDFLEFEREEAEELDEVF